MAALGAFGLLSQTVLARELLVVYFGNELTIGVVFSAWLILGGVGSLAAWQLVRGRDPRRARRWLMGATALAALCLPLQVLACRGLHGLLPGVPGAYAALGPMLASLAVILLPTCLLTGAAFPLVCALDDLPEGRSVSRGYLADALGGMAGGLLGALVFVWALPSLAAVALAEAAAWAGIGCLTTARCWRRRWCLLALALVCLAGCAPALAPLERAAAGWRWRSLLAGEAAVSGGARLVATGDSRYQNLALIEAQGQGALYLNGQVACVFPDPARSEHKIHVVMAQFPAARRVLLLGGNPVDDIPTLLAYPLDALVHVELDGRVDDLLREMATPAYRRALRDPRLIRVRMDPARFVQQAARTGAPLPFDAILADLPAPATTALNRFFTREFYRDLRRILAPRGFLWTVVEASEDLAGEAALLGASVYRALREAFPVVCVTAGPALQFVAGSADGPVTLDRETLAQRSAAAGVPARYFRSTYFRFADELDPLKRERTVARLSAVRVPANTALNPISTFYQVMLWNRFSGSGLERVLTGIQRVRLAWVHAGLLLLGLLGWIIGRVHLRLARGGGRVGAVPMRGLLLAVVAATGGCGMALNLMLLFVFQSLCGYIYAAMGLLAAFFMLGLAGGAAWAPALARRYDGRPWRLLLAGEGLLVAVAGCLPAVMVLGVSGMGNALGWRAIALLVYGLIAAVGAVVAAQFVWANLLLRDAEPGRGTGVAAAMAADQFGAAAGGFAMAVILMPLFGLPAACLLLVTLKLSSVLVVLGAQAAAGQPWARPAAHD